MSKNTMAKPILLFIGLGLSVMLPSLNQVQKYTGTIGVFLYVVIFFLALLIIYRCFFRRFLSRITLKQIFWLAGITLIGLTLIFLLAYPFCNLGIRGGTDRDEDANIGVTELLHLRYPYYAKTYRGNSLSHLPGSLLLSFPFVLLGGSAYQNIFWLLLFIVTATRYLKDSRLAIFLFWLILFLSPVVIQEFVTGGDLLANSIYIVVFIYFMVNSISRIEADERKGILFSILLGIGLSSRINYILVLPLLFSVLVQNAGIKAAAKYTLLTCLVFLLLTIPFYLYDPKGFSPLYIQFSKLDQLHSISPYIAIFVPLIGGIIALALSFKRMKSDCVALFRNCAFVQAFLILIAVILETTQGGKLNFNATGYGFSFLFFGALSFWYELTKVKLAK